MDVATKSFRRFVSLGTDDGLSQPNTILSSAEAYASVPTGAYAGLFVAEGLVARLCGTGAYSF